MNGFKFLSRTGFLYKLSPRNVLTANFVYNNYQLDRYGLQIQTDGLKHPLRNIEYEENVVELIT